MADKRPTIHPFFTVKKRKQTDDTEPAADLSTSIDDANCEEVSDEDASVIIIGDDLKSGRFMIKSGDVLSIDCFFRNKWSNDVIHPKFCELKQDSVGHRAGLGSDLCRVGSGCIKR